LKVSAIERFKPLNKNVVHSDYRLKLNNFSIEGLGEAEQSSGVDDSNTETDSNDTEFTHSQQNLPQVRHHQIFVVEYN
jgi:hypothetical protein